MSCPFLVTLACSQDCKVKLFGYEFNFSSTFFVPDEQLDYPFGGQESRLVAHCVVLLCMQQL